jgi:flagellar assembly protein FliH
VRGDGPLLGAADAEANDAAADAPSLEDQLAEAVARGVVQGRLEAEPMVLVERERLAATIQEIAALRRRVLETAERDVMQLAVGMARRVLHREVQLDPDILLAMARVALGRLGHRVAATAHLHPDDLAAIDRPGVAIEGLTLRADPDLPRGGCRLVSDAGEIDLGVDAQMSELSRVLLGETSSEPRAQLH